MANEQDCLSAEPQSSAAWHGKGTKLYHWRISNRVALHALQFRQNPREDAHLSENSPEGPMAFTESEESAPMVEPEMYKRSPGEGSGVKEKLSMWFALLLAVFLGVQGVRCVLLALDEPRTAWKSVCFAGAAICAFVAFALWRKFDSIRKSLNPED
ncbi:MAG: hypothetical protein ABR902_01945 [Candidatus Korobacteraceae bacterium]|jgi:hypothetical protein